MKSDIEIQQEIEKCKSDIVYFIETYITPEIKLTDFQKEVLKAHQEGKEVHLINTRSGKQMLIDSLQRQKEL